MQMANSFVEKGSRPTSIAATFKTLATVRWRDWQRWHKKKTELAGGFAPG
jgi:hypothetical protein